MDHLHGRGLIIDDRQADDRGGPQPRARGSPPQATSQRERILTRAVRMYLKRDAEWIPYLNEHGMGDYIGTVVRRVGKQRREGFTSAMRQYT